MNSERVATIPDIHGHAKGEHRVYAAERPIAYTPRMLFLWFYHAARRGWPRRLMVSDHINFTTAKDAEAVRTVRRALDLARQGDVIRTAQTADVYVTHASVVADALGNGMRFSIGIEADNDPRTPAGAASIVETMRPDSIIRSVHFIPIEQRETGDGWMWPFDNPEFAKLYNAIGVEKTWALYISTLLKEIEAPCDVVGHFYVPAKFGHWPCPRRLEQYEDQVLEVCRARRLALELNTRVLYDETLVHQTQAYVDANRRLLTKAKARGVKIAVGSDAHRPDDQGQGFEIALALLDECGIDEVDFPTERQSEPVG